MVLDVDSIVSYILFEERLPTEGYYIVGDTRENVMVNIPMND